MLRTGRSSRRPSRSTPVMSASGTGSRRWTADLRDLYGFDGPYGLLDRGDGTGQLLDDVPAVLVRRGGVGAQQTRDPAGEAGDQGGDAGRGGVGGEGQAHLPLGVAGHRL